MKKKSCVAVLTIRVEFTTDKELEDVGEEIIDNFEYSVTSDECKITDTELVEYSYEEVLT